MASVAHVLTDLSQLSGETKRKYPDVRSAIESAQMLAKKLPANAQLSQSEEVQTVFCAPFLLALESGGSKLMALALPSLLRLASSKSLSETHVASIIDTLYRLDAGSSPVETQLKILQLLSGLTSAPVDDDAHLSRLLAVCCRLASVGNIAVSNTASATLQQVYSSLFDRLKEQKRSAVPVSSENTTEKEVDGEIFGLNDGKLEARCHHVISDLSHAFLGQSPKYFTDADIRFRPEAALEILENLLALNGTVFEQRVELVAVLKTETIPGLLEVLNSASSQYSLVIRTLRIAQLLLLLEVAELSEEKELFLASTNHILLDGVNNYTKNGQDFANSIHPYWEKSLVAETYKFIFSNFHIVTTIYDTFDSIDGRKNVLQEVLTVLDSLLNKSYASLFTNDVVQIFTDKYEGPILSRSSATLKTPMMDHLDRSEPPTNIPDLYLPFLVFRCLLGFAEGVSGYVFSISTNANTGTIEKDVDFITSLNEVVFTSVYKLFKKFLLCSSDTETFHMTVRALQKYTHAIGLLGISSARDDLLLLLSECIIKNRGVEEEKKSPSSNLLALGESLVETLSGSGSSSSPTQKPEAKFGENTHDTKSALKPVSRSFNSKQVICFRAFSNLAVSLGSTFQNSWDIVWKTLQWVDYFLEGPDDYTGAVHLKDTKKTGELRLSAQDLSGIKNSQEKLLESLTEYQHDPFFEAFSTLANLYREDEQSSSKATRSIEVCSYNKDFYLKTLVKLATLDTKSVSIINSDIWSFTSSVFQSLSIDRTSSPQNRTHLVSCYMSIIDTIARRNFQANSETELTANKSLDALLKFLQNLLGLGRAQELLVVSCEAEMHLTVLVTLHRLIDDYDDNFKNSWDVVFKILATAFANTEDPTLQSTKIVEKIVSLIGTSFDSLRLILDEFLATLPYSQVKALIDTLLKFCSQRYDLNISFSSVSYFWSISDSIHSSMRKFEGESMGSFEAIETTDQLEALLQDAASASIDYYQALNIYLLSKLSHLSTDERTQVREGAIQTLFQILEIQGREPQSWELIYRIVFPQLLNLSNDAKKSDSSSRKDMVSSLSLILSGLVSVYSNFVLTFDEEGIHYTKFWRRFVEYMGDMLQLRWSELNQKVFETFQDSLLSLKNAEIVPQVVSRLLFEFWIAVPIDYDFVKPDYQDSLALFNESFTNLYDLMQDEFGEPETRQVLNVLNKCARYPVLKPGVNDSTKPSRLQKAVVDNLTIIDKDGSNDEISAAVVQHMAQIAAYPFEVRGRIEAKLKNKFEGRLKIPSFVAVSQYAFEAMSIKLAGVHNMHLLLKDSRLIKIMGDLLDIVRNKASGVIAEETEPLWMRCSALILSLTEKLVNENLDEIQGDEQMWRVLVECITITFRDSDNEAADIKQYTNLTRLVLPALFTTQHTELIKEYLHELYLNSFLHKANAIEDELMKEGDTYRALADYTFEDTFGTTAKVEAESNRGIRLNCLHELFRIAGTDGTSAEIAREYVAIRSAFALRRFIADERLLGYKPLPQIQAQELMETLKGLKEVGQNLKLDHVCGLMKLLMHSVIYADRVEGLKSAIQRALSLGLLQ